MEPPDAETVRCPTCRAVQSWSDTCRRCRSDLRLLREAAESYRRIRGTCLRSIRDGRPDEARIAARRCHDLSPSTESLRLLALVALLLGDPVDATSIARRLLRQA